MRAQNRKKNGGKPADGKVRPGKKATEKKRGGEGGRGGGEEGRKWLRREGHSMAEDISMGEREGGGGGKKVDWFQT